MNIKLKYCSLLVCLVLNETKIPATKNGIPRAGMNVDQNNPINPNNLDILAFVCSEIFIIFINYNAIFTYYY
ncbi:MAG: hypothetical protein WCR97_01370 [Bacilli bacterium]